MSSPDLHKASSRALLARTALLAGATVGLTTLAPAHTVTPGQLTLRPGTSGCIVVEDEGSCAATITVSTNRPDLLDVCQDLGSGPICGCGTEQITAAGTTQTFAICAAPTDPNGNPWQGTQVASVIICWVGFGQDLNGDPCIDDNCSGLPANVFVQVVPDPLSTGQQPYSGQTPDPINTRTGEFFFTEPPDLLLRGPLPLAFQRYYASGLATDGNASSPLGVNWLHNFSWKLAFTGNNVEVVTPSGRLLLFEQPQPGAYSLLAPTDVAYRLVGGVNEYLLADPASELAYAFDLFGRLTRIEDGNGRTLTLTYGGAGGLVLQQVSDGLGRALAFTYLGNGRLDTVSDGTRTVAFGYGAAALETVLDAAGETTTYAYDPAQPAAARLVSRTDPTGRTQNMQAYDGSGRVTTQTNAYGGPLTLAYPGPTGGDTTLVDALGNPSVHTHAGGGELTDVVDESGSSYGYTYDGQGRRTSSTDRLGDKTQWTYHAASGKVASFTAANGAKTSFAYTSRSQSGLTFYDLALVTRPGGATESFARDAAGNVTAYTDPEGGVWTYTYSGTGRLLTATNPLGGVHALTYAADGDLATWTDPSGDVTTFVHDALHRLVSIAHPDGAVSSATYDALDRVLDRTDGSGATTSFLWDEAGRLVQRTDAEGNPVAWSYDAMGWLQARTDGTDGGSTSTLARDPLGRVLALTDATAASALFDHDGVGNLIGVTTPSGDVWSIDSDAESVVNKITDPLGNSWSLTSNPMGWVTRIQSPEGREQRASYDQLGRTTKLTAPGGAALNFTRTPSGQLAGTLGPLAIATAYQHNALGQVTLATDANGEDWTSTYDSGGLQTSLTDPLGRMTWIDYDDRNRVDLVTFADSTTADVTRDGAGRPVSTVFSTGETHSAVYSATGDLESAQNVVLDYDSNGDVVNSNGIAIGRDAAGRVTSLDYGAGRTINYAWGNDHLLDAIIDWLGGTTTFTWTADGSVETLTFPNGITVAFAYDRDGLLTGIDFGAHGSIQLQLGSRGEVLQADRLLPLLATPAFTSALCVYDAASQEVSSTYDLRGRTLMGGGFDYTWSPWAIRSIADGVSSANFKHDAFGRLTQRMAGGFTEDLTWNYAFSQPVLGLRSVGGAQSEAVVPSYDGTPLYTIDLNLALRSFLHYDQGGNVVFRTDDSAAVTDAYAYDSFGAMLGETGTAQGELFTYKAKQGWLREDFTLNAAVHYHHAEGGGGFYRSDLGRNLAFDLGFGKPLLTYRTSPYAPRQRRHYSEPYFLGNGSLDRDPYDDSSSFSSSLAVLGYLQGSPNGYSHEFRASPDSDFDLGTESPQLGRGIGEYLKLKDRFRPDPAVPTSYRRTASEASRGLDDWRRSLNALAFDPRFRNSVADHGLTDSDPIDLRGTDLADNGLPFGSLPRRSDSSSPPPAPENRASYFSPQFGGFRAGVEYSPDGVVDEFDRFTVLLRGVVINF